MERSATVADESRALTGLRGIAALLVMAHHFSLRFPLDEHIPMLHALLRRGYLGVDLFFVLSGFVLSMVYGPWFAAGWSLRAYAVFMVRRAARLWPLHAGILVVLLLLGWGADVALSPRLVAANFAMVQAWDLSTEINPPAWSISTELLAYLLFPGLTLLALRGRMGAGACALAIVVALAVCMRSGPPVGAMRRGWLDIYFNYSPLPVLRCLAGFMTGMLAWRLGQNGAARRVFAWPWLGPLALLTTIVSMAGRVNDLLIYPLLPAIVLGMHWGRGPLQRALAVNPLHGLGVLSYAIYLVHSTVLGRFSFGWAPFGALVAIYVTTTLGVAALAHNVVEVPGRRLLRALGDAALAGRLPLRTRPP